MFRIITYKLTNIKPTGAINKYVEKKFAHLDKFLERVGTPRDCAIEIGKTIKHHKNGKFFRAEADLVLPRRVLRAEAEAYDLYSAIDILKDELERQLHVYKEKGKTKMLKGARQARGKD